MFVRDVMTKFIWERSDPYLNDLIDTVEKLIISERDRCVEVERQRCLNILQNARQGYGDSDLRSIINRIKNPEKS